MPFIPPAGVTSAGTAPLLQVIDPSTPAALLCDWIDPATGDIKSLFAAPSPIVAAVQLAFTVVNNSGASVRDAGQRFADIKKNDDTALQRTVDEVRRIAKPFVDRGHIEIDLIQAINDRDSLGTDDMDAVLFNFTDLVFGGKGSLVLGTQ